VSTLRRQTFRSRRSDRRAEIRVLTRDGPLSVLTLYNRTGTGTGIIQMSRVPGRVGASIAGRATASPPTGFVRHRPAGTGCHPAAEAGNDNPGYNGGSTA